MKPLNKFSTALQTSASRIGKLQADILILLQANISNFIKPEVINYSRDITKINFCERHNQVGDDELAIGASTRALLNELEDEIVGTNLVRRFFPQIRVFYETSVQKILDKFPFEDTTIKELAFLDPRNRTISPVTGIINLATRFCQFSTDEIDILTIQFQDYRACSDLQLPSLGPEEGIHSIDYFGGAMAELIDVSDHKSLRFGVYHNSLKRS